LLINKGELAQAKLAAENAYKADPYLTDVDRTILRLFLASLDLGIRDEAKKWCDEASGVSRAATDSPSASCGCTRYRARSLK
jgi:hypothetical protein